MNNENIVLIVGFVIILINVVVSAIITMYLLPKCNSDFNNNAYNAEQIKELLNKYCTYDVINTKRMMESDNPKPEDCKIVRPRRLCSPGYEINTFSKTLGEDLAKYLLGIETIYKASSKTTESIIEYINTVKQFIRSDTFTSLATSEKQYIVIRIEEQLCEIIFKYIDGDADKLCEDDKTIILDALDL